MRSYCFYTPEKLARELIELIPHRNVMNVIDINCGDGALLRAARSVCRKARLVGVDIEESAIHQELNQCSFYKKDGIEFSKEIEYKYDLVLSNPPFGYSPKIDKDDGIIKELNRKRLECLMFNANLRLLADDGWLLIILPSTFVIGETFRKARISIALKYWIYGIVSLPDETFGSHMIRTYAIIIGKKGRSKITKIYNALSDGEEWIIEQQAKVAYEDIKEGRWSERETDLTSNNISIFRGNVSSADFTDSGIPVLHNATYDGICWKPTIRFVDRIGNASRKTEIDDIIVNRVGHSAGYWWHNTDKTYAISDCVFVVRGVDESVMNSISENGRLKIQTRGVATQYITQSDVLSLIAKAQQEGENHES